ncbi:hypothetical protein NFI96_009012 [Prochilodus magdalenae]|nr:hypothetical protein NFI96_009012 [Prochilodus magdalenae]
METYERLVLSHLKDITNPLLDPLQLAYRANSSVDDTVNMRFHHILQHRDHPSTYATILFLDFSSAFNTIIPGQLHSKLTQLNVTASTCQWITNFLTGREQQLRLRKINSVTQTTGTGAPQGCVLSLWLFSLYTNDCTSVDPSVKILKFAVIGLIQDNGDSAYRWMVDQVVLWSN